MWTIQVVFLGGRELFYAHWKWGTDAYADNPIFQERLDIFESLMMYITIAV